MKINGTTEVPQRNRKISHAFEKHDLKTTLLFNNFIPRNGSFKLTPRELIVLLRRGNGIYWELKTDEFGKITGIIPYDTDTILQNLAWQDTKLNLKDTLYDFERRQM